MKNVCPYASFPSMRPQDVEIKYGVELCLTFFFDITTSTDYATREVLTETLILFLTRQPTVGQGILRHEVHRSPTTTHHSR